MSKIKEFFKEHGDKIVFTFGGILIAVIAFGLGRLTVMSKSTPIEIVNNNSTTDLTDTVSSDQQSELKDIVLYGKFMASAEDNKYFTASVAKLKEIGEDKVIWFDSKEDAQDQGYVESLAIKTSVNNNAVDKSEEVASEGKYVASKSGTKYYLPTCSGVSRIKDENKVWFSTVEEAEAKGLTPAANCPGLSE